MENKTGRYFKYALGEIILVVIGILIALQINNWNDYRKDRNEERKLYKTLIRSLDNDLIDVRFKSSKLDTAIVSQQIFITQSFDSITSQYTSDEFVNLIYSVGSTSGSFVPNISIYNKILQNNQIDLIQSNDLQMQIMELYDRAYWEYKDLDAILEDLAQKGLIGQSFGDFSHLFINDKMTKEDFREHYDKLNDACREIYFLTLAVKKSMLNCEQKIQLLIKSLENELHN